jgi:type I restriction enzyme R subunit
LLNEAIRAFREERIKANEYLKRVTEIMNSVINRTGDDIPDSLRNHDVAKAYFGTVKERLTNIIPDINDLDDRMGEIALKIESIIEKHRIVNWTMDPDVKNRMRNEIDDALFDWQSGLGIKLSFDDFDVIMEQCIDIAKARRP